MILLKFTNVVPGRPKKEKNMNQKKNTNWKTLYIGLLVIIVLMIIAMLLFQNYYK